MRKHRLSNRMRRRIVRHRMCLFAEFLYARRSRLLYEQVRPMRSIKTRWCKFPPHPTDCSESTAMIAHASWAPTPYVKDGAGYTGTMLATLPHVAHSQSRRGDFVVFVSAEHPAGEHVVMLLQGGRRKVDPLVWSHGHNGVDVMPLSEMQAGFPGYRAVYLKTVPERYSKKDCEAAKREAGAK